MTITVSGGVSSSGLTISGGDPLVVLSGGRVQNSTILSGGSATLSAGGYGNDLAVSSGGTLRGTGSAGLVSGAGAVQGVTLSYLDLLSGGTASDVTESDGLTEIFAGATASGMVDLGGSVEVAGSAVDTVVGSHGVLAVNSGGVASGDTIHSGGSESVASGAVVSDDTVLSGGALRFGGDLNQIVTVSSTPLTGAEGFRAERTSN
jgi:autotransporter passenger strand-loop-strand repeat protein